jgi:uncharacterized membrane protein
MRVLLCGESWVTPSLHITGVLESYVRGGGGLLMTGGYLSFAGIEGKAR